MEARSILKSLAIVGAMVLFILSATADGQLRAHRRSAQGQYRVSTTHFIVTAPDARLANQVGQEAERFRKSLAILWLGKELGPWREKCPIQVEIGMHAGGETSFAFDMDRNGKGVPISWQMKIFGPPDRLLDAVLPHEITHTIFATHFGRPLPRWADEGACTTVEHESERQKNHQMLLDFLTAKPSRGIPFNRMFTMRNYPHDILPLYAQGYSLAKFLILKKGRRQFIDFVSAGLDAERPGVELRAWDQVTKSYYGYQDLSELQIVWLKWVRLGSPQHERPQEGAQQLAGKSSRNDLGSRSGMSQQPDNRVAEILVSVPRSQQSWYVREMQRKEGRVATHRLILNEPVSNDLTSPPSNDARLNRYPVQPATLWR